MTADIFTIPRPPIEWHLHPIERVQIVAGNNRPDPARRELLGGFSHDNNVAELFNWLTRNEPGELTDSIIQHRSILGGPSATDVDGGIYSTTHLGDGIYIHEAIDADDELIVAFVTGCWTPHPEADRRKTVLGALRRAGLRSAHIKRIDLDNLTAPWIVDHALEPTDFDQLTGSLSRDVTAVCAHAAAAVILTDPHRPQPTISSPAGTSHPT